MLKKIHNPSERAAYTATVLGITMNLESYGYGGTGTVRAMKGEDLVIHSLQRDVVSFLCGLYGKVEAILALLKSENIDIKDSDLAIESLSKTVASKKNIEVYNYWIHKNESLAREINK